MKIELKNLKHLESLSEETHCFTATIYVDGKKAGDAQNRGHGGPTSIHPYQLEGRLNTYAATLPEMPFGSGIEGTFKQTGETLIDDMVTDELLRRDMKKALKTKLLFTKPGEPGVFTTKRLATDSLKRFLANQEETRKQLKADKVLNFLPEPEALAIFLADGART